MKVSRIRTHFAWDGIFHTSVKVQTTFETNSSLQLTFLDVFNQVQSRCSDSGKEGKFQTFICVLLRDGVLSIFLPLIRDCCTDIYNNDAFLYDQAAIIFLEQMNRILETKKLTVDESLTKVKVICVVCKDITFQFREYQKLKLKVILLLMNRLLSYQNPLSNGLIIFCCLKV